MNTKIAANDADLKSLVKAIGDSGLLISEITQGLSFGEIGQLIAVIEELPPVINDLNVIWPEFNQLNAAAQADLIAYIQSNVQFPSNIVIQAWAQKVLSVIVMLSSVIQVFKGAPNA